MELRTRAASLRATACHRIVVPDAVGAPCAERRAEDLEKGDRVFVGDQVQDLVKTPSLYEMATAVVEVCFQPDEPVQTFLSPRWCVLSFGNAGQDDLESIPATDDGF